MSLREDGFLHRPRVSINIFVRNVWFMNVEYEYDSLCGLIDMRKSIYLPKGQRRATGRLQRPVERLTLRFKKRCKRKDETNKEEDRDAASVSPPKKQLLVTTDTPPTTIKNITRT